MLALQQHLQQYGIYLKFTFAIVVLVFILLGNADKLLYINDIKTFCIFLPFPQTHIARKEISEMQPHNHGSLNTTYLKTKSFESLTQYDVTIINILEP